MPRLTASIAALALLGCASTGPIVHPPFDRTVSINAPYDDVWNALIELASERGWPVANLEKESGFLNINEASVGEGWRFDCRSGFTTVISEMQMRMSFVVREAGETTELTVSVNGRGFRESILTDNTMGWETCDSLGYAERAIQNAVRELVGDPVRSEPETALD